MSRSIGLGHARGVAQDVGQRGQHRAGDGHQADQDEQRQREEHERGRQAARQPRQPPDDPGDDRVEQERQDPGQEEHGQDEEERLDDDGQQDGHAERDHDGHHHQRPADGEPLLRASAAGSCGTVAAAHRRAEALADASRCMLRPMRSIRSEPNQRAARSPRP